MEKCNTVIMFNSDVPHTTIQLKRKRKYVMIITAVCKEYR